MPSKGTTVPKVLLSPWPLSHMTLSMALQIPYLLLDCVCPYTRM